MLLILFHVYTSSDYFLPLIFHSSPLFTAPTVFAFWPMAFPSGLSMGVCCLTGGPVDTRPTLFLAVLALIWGTMMSAPGKSLVWRRRFPACEKTKQWVNTQNRLHCLSKAKIQRHTNMQKNFFRSLSIMPCWDLSLKLRVKVPRHTERTFWEQGKKGH